MLNALLLNSAIKIFLIFLIAYGTGCLVFHKGVKVNYTRKINHFSILFIPVFLDIFIPYDKSIELITLSLFFIVCAHFIFIQPIRSKVPIVSRMFLSFDRPEDRPHTLKWFISQAIAGYVILIPAIILFIESGYRSLILIPILINGFGDGLAEPVGIRFGKHKYKTKALFSKREYERSFEGSSCVFIASIIVLFLFRSLFSEVEFIWALIVLPLAMTITEAFSPHTWDTPFLFLIGYTILYLIVSIPF